MKYCSGRHSNEIKAPVYTQNYRFSQPRITNRMLGLVSTKQFSETLPEGGSTLVPTTSIQGVIIQASNV
jgi:hypothetical protein